MLRCIALSAVMTSSNVMAVGEGEVASENSLGIRFVRIPSGAFLMGGGEASDWDEKPAHSVNLSLSFSMAVTEVTNAQYEQFDPEHRQVRGRAETSGGDDDAVVFVSWRDAMAFCKWLSQKEGKPYRLPTEAEWEYACRAGTTTLFNTGESLPEAYQKNQKLLWAPEPVSLRVGTTPPNAWGLCDMHGNVEEWCSDWYGPYPDSAETNPIGPGDGDFKVTRGGSHSTEVPYLRSANRMGALPEDKHELIGFRVVMADLPKAAYRALAEAPLWAQGVSQKRYDWPEVQDHAMPFFSGPVEYVKIPAGSNGPLFSNHNHCPALTACPNGDLLAIWYTCVTERGRELGIVASRLRKGQTEWDPASPFWDAPDRNDHASALLWDGRDTIYHFNGLSSDATWGKLALIVRTSVDNGITWSKARIVQPEHGLRHMPIAGVFQMSNGAIVLPCDAARGGAGGTALQISTDAGQTFVDPGQGQPNPSFEAGSTGAWIAGIHAGVVELKDGRLMALGRGNEVEGQMPKSISSDGGKTWVYSTSGLPPIGGGQRLVLRRLAECPIFLASFDKHVTFKDSAGQDRTGSGLFAALSENEGETWPVRRLITDEGPARWVDGGGNTGPFAMGPNNAEPAGYLACIQTPDRMIHLISSKQHYVFNLAWMKSLARPESP